MNLEFNANDFLKKLGKISTNSGIVVNRALSEMADALLLLSQAEVPLDEATLQNSGHTRPNGKDWEVAYGGSAIDYAVFQHEGMRKDGTHIVVNHQHGRKSKYLEDPLLNNTSKWNSIFSQTVLGLFK